MPEILFTEYVLPHGQVTLTAFDRPQHIFDKAAQIVAAGFRFECEVLRTGVTSFTIVGDFDGEPDDLDICLVATGPGWEDALDNFIMGFDVAGALRQVGADGVETS